MINPQIRIRRLKIRNYRGVQEMDIEVKPGGAVFAGRNRAGKTSALKALRAGMQAEGVGPDAIRNGCDESEILIDLTAVTAKRKIKQRSTSLEVRDSDGMVLPKPPAQLRELLGDSSLDPLAFYLADAKERRRLIVEAMPVRVTAEDLNRWTGVTRDWNVEGHGSEVLARVRDSFYAMRTDANRALAEAESRMELARENLGEYANCECPTTTAAARTLVSSAERTLAVLKDRRTQAAEQDERAEGSRNRIAELRRQAEEKLAEAPLDVQQQAEQELDRADERLRLATAKVEEIRQALQAAEREAVDAAGVALGWRTKKQLLDRTVQDAAKLAAEANELEATLDNLQAGMSTEAITAEIAKADLELKDAQALLVQAERFEEAKQVREAHRLAKETLEKRRAEAENLDGIVKRLTKDAPAELAKRSNMIPGLEVTPNAIMLDGVNLDHRSGAEQMAFAVDLAKRLADHAKILIVDGLERIDPEEQPKFIAMACAGGWQLFGSLVQAGELAVLDLPGSEEAV